MNWCMDIQKGYGIARISANSPNNFIDRLQLKVQCRAPGVRVYSIWKGNYHTAWYFALQESLVFNPPRVLVELTWSAALVQTAPLKLAPSPPADFCSTR